MRSELEISTDPSRLDVDLVYEFLQTSYWAKGCRRSVIERSIRNSLCFGAYQDERQVAFARVVSDRAVFAYLMGVFVRLLQELDTPVRVRAMWFPVTGVLHAKPHPRKQVSNGISYGDLKLILDGTPIERSAAMRVPHTDAQDLRGD